MPIQPNQVSASCNAGGVFQETYTLTDNTGNPINLTGWTWEFIVRPNVGNTTEPALISVTTTSGSQGVITVTTPTSGVVEVTLTPAATALLGQGVYVYALWSNPGTTTATPWVWGNMTSSLVAVP